MISNQILQNTIEGLKAITRIDLCVMDIEGKVLASTFSNAEDYEKFVLEFVNSPADSQVLQGFQFFKVFDEHQLEFIILARGDSDDVYMIGKVASFQIQNLLVAYKERFDKDNFIKNLLLDNLLLVDIYNRAKKLHIETEVRRVVYIVETNREKDGNELEKVRSIFGGKSKDFVTAVDEKNIIVVKELADKDGSRELEKMAKEMMQDRSEAEALGLTDEEMAFYDAITKPQAVKDFYDNDQLVAITRELTEAMRSSATIDWQRKENARAGMRRAIKRLLRKYKYPPEGVDDAMETVMAQCELWADTKIYE